MPVRCASFLLGKVNLIGANVLILGLLIILSRSIYESLVEILNIFGWRKKTDVNINW